MLPDGGAVDAVRLLMMIERCTARASAHTHTHTESANAKHSVQHRAATCWTQTSSGLSNSANSVLYASGESARAFNELCARLAARNTRAPAIIALLAAATFAHMCSGTAGPECRGPGAHPCGAAGGGASEQERERQ